MFSKLTDGADEMSNQENNVTLALSPDILEELARESGTSQVGQGDEHAGEVAAAAVPAPEVAIEQVSLAEPAQQQETQPAHEQVHAGAAYDVVQEPVAQAASDGYALEPQIEAQPEAVVEQEHVRDQAPRSDAHAFDGQVRSRKNSGKKIVKVLAMTVGGLALVFGVGITALVVMGDGVPSVGSLSVEQGSQPPLGARNGASSMGFEDAGEPLNAFAFEQEHQEQLADTSTSNGILPMGETIVIPYSIEEDEAAEPAPVPAFSGLTEEERMYDALLESAQTLDVPIEAIKIDRSVIEGREREQRVSAVEKAITSTRAEIGQLSQSITHLNAESASMRKTIDENAKTTQAIRDSIEKIEALVNTRMGAVDKRIASMEAKAAAAPAPAAPKAPAKPKPAPVKQPQAPAKQEVAKVAPRPAPAPAKPVIPATNRPAQPAVAAQAVSCSATGKASQVWRVAGANSNSAYLVRAQDNASLVVQLGTQVPGFGVVQGIDLATRTVCTSSGVIRR